MKRSILIPVILCMLATTVFAGNKSYYVFAFSGFKSTAVSIERKADYVSMSVSIQSNQKEPTARLAEIKTAQNLIFSKAKEQLGIVIHKGPISLSPQPLSKLSSISSTSYSQLSVSQLNIMVELDDTTDIYGCASRIQNLLDSITMPGKSEYSLGQIQLAMANPEQYRHELLQKISEDVVFVRKTMQTSGTMVSISGLEQPVLVRQMDDQMVELFINYSMTLELSNNAIETDQK